MPATPDAARTNHQRRRHAEKRPQSPGFSLVDGRGGGYDNATRGNRERTGRAPGQAFAVAVTDADGP